MSYPIDVEGELDQVVDKLANVRVTSEKWDYFKWLVEEINEAYLAGVEGIGGYPWDIGANLSADMERLGGLGAAERRLVISWMERINEAYRRGRIKGRYAVGENSRARRHLPQEEKIPVGALEFVDPESGTVLKVVKDSRDLEYYLSKYVRKGKPFSFRVPGVERIATVQIQKVRASK